ncbi:MAG: DsbC family protein [Massilia sp.]
MLKSKLVLLALASGLIASCFAADNAVEANIRKLVAPRLSEGAKIESVKETPYGGLYEVRVGNSVFYTDKKGEYLIQGHIFNTRSAEDLTQLRLDDLNKIRFSELPFENAVKLVKGDGKRVMAIFEDPNCGYCKKFRQNALKDVTNVTVYTFMYNILSPDSAVRSRNIWCSADRNKAWDEWMVDGKAAPAAPAKCESPNDEVAALGHRLGINATPQLFFADGSRIAGAIDTAALEAKFKSIK